ncbi:hypothetical protein C2S53_009054 [Perilla frutescens var. hirtella]|uniref:Protein kinase domain-containing protein n=1 Tax=Perilla frutescens var. hirtella TaxID=608512 RepID=A0AAD4IXC7_PERFH|nr:hypothetical protein C2S53_009054 [Perilla frutescens var. hirtella]
MDNSLSLKLNTISSLLLLLSSLSLSSTAYTIPPQYFINCGSPSSTKLYGLQTFVGDENSGVISSGNTSPVENSTSSNTEIYQTARIFRNPSVYELDIAQNGTHVVRFHFFPFSALGNLSDARFSVEASIFKVLSNFSFQNSSNYSNFPIIEEFLITIPVGKLRIRFLPDDETNSFAFVNAMEVFIAPPDLIRDATIGVSREGREANDDSRLLFLLSSALHIIHRINVGGENITSNSDKLYRNWIPDDNYLLNKEIAKNSVPYGGRLSNEYSMELELVAPSSVYITAKEFSASDDDQLNSSSRIQWRFDVKKGATHLVRLHFCDIVSTTANEFLRFNLFINSNFTHQVYPYDHGSRTAAPFYIDFKVDSDDSGFMNISVGPKNDSRPPTAFLNGLEIFELLTELGSESNTTKRSLVLIVTGSCIGGLIFVVVCLIMLYFVFRKRKWKPADQTFNHPVAPLYVGSTHSKSSDKTVSGSSHDQLNLGLKLSFSEIVYATKNFDTKLVIGEGGFGKVYKGMLRNGIKVAVKRSEAGHGQGIHEFQTEIIVLSKIRYQHLVSLIGYCDEGDEMILVYEFMEKGTLREHLYVVEGETGKSNPVSELSWEERLGICIGAAKGIHYLHTGSSVAIIHRDIKSTNILLDSDYVAKVADFGLSRSGPADDQTHVSTAVKGSFGYLDPDYFRCLQLSQKSDVYSFGVVLLEVVCARPVIDQLLQREEVSLAEWGMCWQRKGELEKIVDGMLVGKINPNSLRKFGETVEKCLEEYGGDRPNMVDVLWDLEYCLQLQHTAIVRAPYEDTTTDVALGLGIQMNVLQRLPSHSISMGNHSCSFSESIDHVREL